MSEETMPATAAVHEPLSPAEAFRRKVDCGLLVGLDRNELMARPEDVKATLLLVRDAVRDFRKTVVMLPLQALEEVFEYEGAFGCFFDPTGWRQNRDEKAFNRAMVEATRSFHERIGKMIADEKGCQAIHGSLAKGFPCVICGLPGDGTSPGGVR